MESYQQVSVSDSYIVPTLAKPVIASIKPPGSKSITNRALLCAALANGKTTLNGCLRSDDTRVMINALSQLGLNVGEDTNDGSISIEGQALHLGKTSLLSSLNEHWLSTSPALSCLPARGICSHFHISLLRTST